MYSRVLLLSLLLVPSRMHLARNIGCRIQSDGSVQGQSADICARVVRRWRLLAPLNGIAGTIQIDKDQAFHNASGPSGWILGAPMAANARRTTRSDGVLPYFAESIIPHEAGHLVLEHHLSVRTAAAAANTYGTPAPDWLDEAAAVWMESRDQREQRMRLVIGQRPSLTTFVAMHHPNRDVVIPVSEAFLYSSRTVTPPCARCTWLPDSLRRMFQIIDIVPRPGSVADTVTWYADHDPTANRSVEVRDYYPLAYSLLRFIRITGGMSAVIELMSRVRTNPSANLDAIRALPGLPSDLAAFERAWHAFLRNPPREDE